MTTPPFTLPEVMCLERALGNLPDFHAPTDGEVMILGHPVERIDAWGGAALRCMVEYHARFLQRRTTLIPCSAPEAWGLLYGLIRDDAPPHLVLHNEAAEPEPAIPPSVLLSARPVAAIDQASMMAERLLEAAGKKMERPARFAAKYLPEFIQNSLKHSEWGPVPPIACAFHDSTSDEIQLVVVDTGTPRSSKKESLEARVLGGESSSLATLVKAGRDSFNVKLELAAGEERLRSTGSSWISGEKDPISGFCTALTVSEK